MALKLGQNLILLISMFIFTLGFGVIVPVIPYFVRDLGASALDMGLLMATMSAMQLICAPVWGRISDRIGRKPVILLGLIGFAVSFIMVGLSTEMWMLYVSQIIGGGLSAGIWPACLAYIADTSTPGERGKYMGLMGAASGAGMIFGPAISSFFTAWGLTAPFFASAGLGFVTAIFSLLFLKESRVPGNETRVKQKMSFEIVMKSHLMLFFMLMLFTSFAIACLDATFTYFIMDKFGLTEGPSVMPFLTGNITMSGPGVSGLIFTCMGIVLVICQGLMAGKAIEKLGEERTMLIGLAILALGLLLIIVAPELITLIVFVCFVGAGASILMPCLNTLVSKRTDPENQGVMMGLLGSFNSMGRVIGPLAGGAAYTIAMSLPYVGSAIASVIGIVAIYLSRRGSAVESPVESART